MTTDGSLAGRDPARQGDVRPAAAADWLRVSWLLETARRVFTDWGGRNLRELLAGPGAVVWEMGRALRGVVVADMSRGEVAEARLVAVHDDADTAPFGREVLSRVEGRLAERGARWLSFTSPEGWLLEVLRGRRYALKDRMVTYARRGVALEAGESVAVTVRRAVADDVPGMMAVDAAAFEPFWRMGGEALRRALAEEAYVLVAVQELPLPELAEREQEAGAEPSAEGGRRGRRRSDRGRARVVGYVVADVWGVRGHVVRLGVAPASQGRGVARRLMAEVFGLLAGVEEVTLNTQEGNARSRSLYEGLGFRPTGRVEEVWARGLEAVD